MTAPPQSPVPIAISQPSTNTTMAQTAYLDAIGDAAWDLGSYIGRLPLAPFPGRQNHADADQAGNAAEDQAAHHHGLADARAFAGGAAQAAALDAADHHGAGAEPAHDRHQPAESHERYRPGGVGGDSG